MKKLSTLMLILLVAASFTLFANGEQEAASGAGLEDGVYFAQADEFSERTGWKYNVTLEVEGGEVVSAVWDSAHVDSGTGKRARSMNGEYGMVEKGDAMAPWYEQAEAVEAYFLETQDTATPDSISGATIGLEDFFSLAEKALAKGPVGYGPYKDGTYSASQDEFGHGYKYFVEVTVISGYVVAANWDALAEGGGKNKQQASQDGDYGMVEKGDAMAPWWEQARAVEDYFLANQDLSQPDAISGATIGLDEFYTLVSKALDGAKR